MRDRMLTTQESADTKSIPMDALPVNETRTSEFIQPLASVIDDETASKLARRADPRMMSYMRDRPDLSGAGSTPTGKAELFFGNLDRASLDDHEHRHSLLEHPGLTISYSGQNRTAIDPRIPASTGEGITAPAARVRTKAPCASRKL